MTGIDFMKLSLQKETKFKTKPSNISQTLLEFYSSFMIPESDSQKSPL